MIANVDRKELLKALKIAQLVTKKSDSGLNTDCLVLEALEGGILRIAGTNVDLGVVVKIPAAVGADGKVVFNAKRLLKVISVLTDEEVIISGPGIGLVSDAKMLFTLETFDPTKTLAAGIPDRTCEMPAEKMLYQANRVLYASSTDPSRPVLQSVSFNGAVAATNGFEIAVAEGVEGIHGLVPNTFLRMAGRIFGRNKLQYWQEGNRCALSNGSITLEGYTVEGNFPDFEAIMPRDVALEVEFDTLELLDTLRAILTFGGGRPAARMKINPDKPVKITVEYGDEMLSATLPAGITVNGEFKFPFTVGFNAGMLRDQIRQSGFRVRLGFNHSNTPFLVTPTDPTNDFSGCIMPMHLG